MNCPSQMQRSTVSAMTDKDVEYKVGDKIEFEDCSITGCGMTRPSATELRLKAPGLYLVSFNGCAEKATAAGDIKVKMKHNGEDVEGASAASNNSSGVSCLGFSTIVSVGSSCSVVDNSANLTFVNTGIASVFHLSNITVVKVS